MYRNLLHSLVLVAIIGVLSSCSWQLMSNNNPNVIIVLSDDQGWGDTGYNGNKLIQTPVLDSLTTVGVVFDRFYVSPDCASTSESILTGKYNVATPNQQPTCSDNVRGEFENNIAEVLRANGYSTAYFGKWNSNQDFQQNSLLHGFDTFFGYRMGFLDNYFDTEIEYKGCKVSTNGYILNVITDSVLTYISSAEKPFLAFVAYNAPQLPNQVPNIYIDKYLKLGLDHKTAAIYGMCENIDDNVLRIKNALKKAQKNDNTIFIFLSDNGPDFVRYNGGFKGRKLQVDEGGVKVPFIIDFPNGKFIQRKIDDDFAAHIDLFPTILDLCSISADTLEFDGESFAEILIDSTKHLKDRNFFTNQVYNNENYAWAVRTNKYLLTCYHNDTALYNLKEDPCQMIDLIACEPMVYKLLINDYNTWLKQTSFTRDEMLVTK